MKTAPGCAVEHDAKAVVEGGVALCANSRSLSTVLPGAVRGRVNPLLLPFLGSERRCLSRGKSDGMLSSVRGT